MTLQTTQKVKHLASINDDALPESTHPDREILYLDISSVGRGRTVAEPEALTFASSPSRARRLVRSGDTIVSTVRTYLRAVLSIWDPDPALVVSTGFAVLRPGPRLDPRFFSWVIQSDQFVEEVVARSVGVSYPAINASEIGDIRVPLPPLVVQRSIADYLDAETARIDALIAKKQRMIELLRERLRLAPEASLALLRDESELVALKFLVQESDQRRGGNVARVLLSVSIHHGVVPRSEASDKESRADDFTNYKTCEPGDIVINRMRAFQGAVGVVNSPGIVSPDYTVLRLGTRLEPEFVHYLMRSHWFIGEMASRIRGIGAVDQGQVRTPRVNFADLREIAVPVPPAEEQVHLVSGWRAQEAGVRAVVQRLERQAELLREHRQALITAAVTGELEVPGVAA